ncbi:MAG: hypothetical protein HPY74_17670 [Firmicutes bacterium]|nr:hypothetical protein [Bacillota bacterium]
MDMFRAKGRGHARKKCGSNRNGLPEYRPVGCVPHKRLIGYVNFGLKIGIKGKRSQQIGRRYWVGGDFDGKRY